MSFRFPFVAIPTSKPIVSLAGRAARPRPLVPISVINPQSLTWHRYRACLDTAADDTVFHVDTAKLLGIDLTGAPPGQAQPVTGRSVTLRYADVFLQLAGPDGDLVEWQATVAFAATLRVRRKRLFSKYWRKPAKNDTPSHCWVVELIPNNLLPRHSPTRI